MTLLDLFDAALRDRRAATALEGPALAGGSWTYAELARRAEGRAAALVRAGVGRGDHVAMLSGNRAEVAELLLASWRLGAAVLPINTRYTPREVSLILDDARPRVLAVDAGHHALAGEVLAGRPGITPVVLDEPAPVTGSFRTARGIDGGTPALLMYTSGTTGRSKGAQLSHANVIATIAALIAAWRIVPGDRLLLALPLFHTHGLVVGMLTALAAGATIVLCERFEPRIIAGELAAGRASLFYGVPTIYRRLLDVLPVGAQADFSRVRLFCSGSAPLPAETFAAFRERTGHEILERYGMTETGMILANPYAGPRLPGTVGVPLPGVSIRVVADDGSPLADGREGELLVRGPNVFGGYLGDPRKTRESFLFDAEGERWFRTGDLARRDPRTGHVSLLGRRHELIISGGLNVYPREVEDVITAHPQVVESAVLGMPDPEWGERVVAFVVARGQLDERRLLAWARERIAGFKMPREVHFVASLPRNAMGKLDRGALRSALPGGGAPEEGERR